MRLSLNEIYIYVAPPQNNGDVIRKRTNPQMAELLASHFSAAGFTEADILTWLDKRADLA